MQSPVRAYGWMESQAPGSRGLRDAANDRPHYSTFASRVASNASIKGDRVPVVIFQCIKTRPIVNGG
jgi:hypothetical protein